MPDPTKGPEPVRGELSPEDRAKLERRMGELVDKLGRAKAAHTPQVGRSDVLQGRGMAYGLRMASEFVAAIVVGGLVGWALDWWLVATKPWLFLVFFVLGLVAGVVNVTRGYNQVQAEIAAKTGGNIGQDMKDKDDD